MIILRTSLALAVLLVGVCSLDAVPKGSTQSAPKSPTPPMRFQVIDRNSIDAAWDGSPLILQASQSAKMPKTNNGSMVLAYQNLSKMNNQGTLSVTSGGLPPSFLTARALTNQPSVLINNWGGNNLGVTNISDPGSNTPIQIQAIGPGYPGTTPLVLTPGPTSLSMKPGQTAQGDALPQWMQLVFQSNTSQLNIFVLIGGPPDTSGNNALMIAVNAGQEAGPGTKNPNTPPPAGYYATTTQNTYYYQFNWGSDTIFVANMSGLTASPAQVTLRAL
ncbi:MAG: hypothetical protein ACJ74T_19580 [Pyrinomonadaceae bacterium]